MSGTSEGIICPRTACSSNSPVSDDLSLVGPRQVRSGRSLDANAVHCVDSQILRTVAISEGCWVLPSVTNAALTKNAEAYVDNSMSSSRSVPLAPGPSTPMARLVELKVYGTFFSLSLSSEGYKNPCSSALICGCFDFCLFTSCFLSVFLRGEWKNRVNQ